ncbi:MAG: hypothetical protein K2N08_09095 [Muribaculaceae bacterium]|nr:hypothetical protein [Muribaculaceae bacterium]
MILASCSHDKYSDLIDRAETLIDVDNNPGEALSLLHKICFDSILSEKNKARYGYLYARGMHKTWQKMDSDLFIKQSVDYYRSKGDSPELMKSLFYYSNYLYENGLNEAAVRTLMKSRNLAIKFNDDYWRAKTAELLALILSSGHNYQDAIKYNNEAVEYYDKVDCAVNRLYSCIDLARCYGNILQFDQCIAITDSILEIAKNECDSSLMAYCYKTKYEYYFDMKEYSKAKESMNEYLRLNKFYPCSKRDDVYAAWLLIENHEIDSAMILLSNIRKQPLSLKLKGMLYQIYRDVYSGMANYKSANEYSDSLLQVLDSLSRISHSQLLVAAQRDYLDEGLKSAEIKNIKQRSLLLFVVAVALLVVTFTVLFYQYRLKVRRLENERKVNDIMIVFNNLVNRNHELEQTVKSQEEALGDVDSQIKVADDLRAKMELLYRNQWELLNSLCYDYFEKKDSDKFRDYMFNKIEEELQKFKEQLNNSQIIESIDKYLDGLASRFMEQCDFLSDMEQRFALLIFAGFSPRAICLFMGFKQKNFYAKKRLILSKIEESNVADRDLFLRFLE